MAEKDYYETLGVSRNSSAEEIKKSGIDYLNLLTNEPIAHKLRHFFRSRALLSRGTR